MMRPLASVRQTDGLTAAMFGSVLSCGLAVLYWIGRTGFANPLRPIAVTLGLALFIICVPAVIAAYFDGQEISTASRWWRSQSFVGIVCIAITAFAGMLAYPTKVNLGAPILVVGAVAFALTVFLWIANSRVKPILFLVGFVVFFTAWVGGIAWGTRYKTPLFWEQLSDHGDVHHDPLYYVSMANSMRSYGVPSTALDGVPYTPYHYGSAWLNAEWSDLARVDVLTFYSLGPTVLMAPVFFAGLLLFAGNARSAWRRTRPGSATAKPLQEDWLAWLVLIGATIGFVPSSALDALAIWNRHLLISESYLTGLGVFVLSCGLSVSWWFSRAESSAKSDGVFLMLVVPVLLVSLGFLKVSLMLLALAAILWTILRSRAYRQPSVVIGAALALVASAVTFKLVSVAAQNQGITPFSFMRFYADERWWPYFILGHLLWAWLYVALRVYEERTPTLRSLFDAIRNGRLLDVELVVVIAVCGFLPGELITIHGGSAVYFSDVQRWVGAPLVMASATRIIAPWLFAVRPKGFASTRLSMVLAWLIAIPVSLTILLNVGRAVRTAALMNLDLRSSFYGYAGVVPESARRMTNPHVLAAGEQKAPDYALISTLRSLDQLTREVKGKTLLFVPQSDPTFWKIFAEPERCSFAPLVGPATSGMALLDGMPPESCDLTDQYGMPVYARRTRPQADADVTPHALCAQAERKGFRQVIVLRRANTGAYTTPMIDCRAAQ